MAAAAAQLLGEDGRGYELARRLEACGAWRAWLGDDTAHATLAQHLTSPVTWDAFLSPAASPSTPPLPLLLQLRVRALLFDKASAALLLPPRGAAPTSLHSVNSNYLQLHGDDIYYSLEGEQEDNTQHQVHSRTAFSPNRDGSMLSQRHNWYDELPDTWYKQYADKFKTRHSKLRSGEKEIPKRTPEGMSDYLKVCSVHKRKRAVFMDDSSISAPMLENGPSLHSKNAGEFSNSTDETLIPEIRFPVDCVPESAIPRTSGISMTNKIEVQGVLDNLPAPVNRNTAMLERFGMVPEYYKTGNKYRGKDGSKVEGKSLSQEQALLMTRKLVARYLANSGFESGTAVSIDVLSEIVIKHMCKLGRNLKLLSDSYRKQFSSIELLKMFLQTIGYSNIGPLMEITKIGNRVASYPIHQEAQVLQSQNPNPLLHAQQVPRQFTQHLLQSLTPQQQQQFHSLTPQQQQLIQQQQWLRRTQQLSSPRGPLMMADKNQPLVNVKIENTMDSQTDSPYGSFSRQQQFNIRQQQLLQQQQQQQLQHQHLQQQQQFNPQQQQLQQQQQQLNQQQQLQQQQQLNQQQQLQQQQQLNQQQQLQQQQQQLNQQQQQQLNHHQQQHQLNHHHLQQQQKQQQMTMSANQNAQLAQQYKQVPSMNAYGMRMPHVKVEAFHELVSGDSSLKHDNDPNKLTSPK